MISNSDDIVPQLVPVEPNPLNINSRDEPAQSFSKRKSLIVLTVVIAFVLVVISVGAFYIMNTTVPTNSIMIESPLPIVEQSNISPSNTSSTLSENNQESLPFKTASTIPIDCSDQAVSDPDVPQTMLDQICDLPENTITRKFADGKSGECKFSGNGADHIFIFSKGKYFYNWINQENPNDIDGKAYQNNLTYGWDENIDLSITLKVDDMTAIYSVPIYVHDTEELYQTSCVERDVSDEELSPPDREWKDAMELRKSFNNQ